MGAEAIWDAANETGQVAAAVVVPSVKTQDFSHAAIQLSKRPNWEPKAMYSDTWPNMSGFWEGVIPNLEGVLGLFHYTQRMIKTLRHTHPDYYLALSELLNCIYDWNKDDYNNLIRVLKNGTMSKSGHKYTDREIQDMERTKYFKDRYQKHLRKEIRKADDIEHRLELWKDRFKCTKSTELSAPAGGRRNPDTGETLFTPETKKAVQECQKKAKHLQDPLPLEEMYYTIAPHPKSKHQLPEYLSRRGESNLEAFHLLLAHFGNNGMRASLADNLMLTGTARYNLQIRHKLRLTKLAADDPSRNKMPAGWETVVPFFNHSEPAHVNQLAKDAGVQEVPFATVEELVADAGERFFSEHLTWMQQEDPPIGTQDH